MQDWIPLKKEYPKNNQKILFTVRELRNQNDFVVNGVYQMQVDRETAEITNIFKQTNCRLDYNDLKNYKVTAWMPCPDPYNSDFRVIVAGSRKFADYNLLKSKLDEAFARLDRKNIVILCGEAQGADILGKKYGIEKGIRVESYPADWVNEGKSAGYLRNERMAENAKALVAFWDGSSAGTKHMIETAKARGLQVKIIRF